MHSLQSLKKTNASYNKAMTQLSELTGCTHFESYGSGYSHYLGTTWRVNGDFTPEATKFSFRAESLFEGWSDRPKSIGAGTWVWDGYFVKLEISVSAEFSVHHENYGNEKQADKQDITLYMREKSFGLGNWTKSKADLLAIASKMKPDLRKALIADIEETDAKVEKWKKALKKKIELPS